MPAHKKYLTKSPWQRFLKITAGFIGGYCVSISFHQFLCHFIQLKYVMMTAVISAYILWAVLLLFAFLAEKAWKVWLIYFLLTVVFAIPVLLKL